MGVEILWFTALVPLIYVLLTRIDERRAKRTTRVRHVRVAAGPRLDIVLPTPAPAPRPPSRPVLAPMPPVGVWRDVLSSDTTEHALLATLRARPGDELTRMVYGDWLEQRGQLANAEFVRAHGIDDATVLATTDASWRAITSHARIDRCIGNDCPRLWSALEPADGDELARRCSHCQKTARYCTTPGEARRAELRGELIVLDVKPPLRGTLIPRR